MDVLKMIEELDGGNFLEKLTFAVKETALNVAEHEKTGKVVITLKLRPLPATGRVNVEHDLVYTRPTRRGEVTMKDQTETPMHVGRGGTLTFFPEAQLSLYPEGEHSREREDSPNDNEA